MNLSRIARAVHRFWFRQIDPFVLGVFRILVGLFTLVMYLLMAPSWLECFGPDGMAPLNTLQNFSAAPWFPLNFVSTSWGIWLFWCTCVLASLALTAGVGGRIPLLWLFASNLGMQFRNPWAVQDEHAIVRMIYLYALFLPLDRTCTLPQMIRHGRNFLLVCQGEKVTVWALTLMQVNIVLIYPISLVYKLYTDWAWRDGTEVYYVMMNVELARWPGLALFGWLDGFVSRFLTYWTLVVQAMMPFFIWLPRFRLGMIVCGVLMHAGFGLLINNMALGIFVMTAAYASFLPSRRTREFLIRRFEVAPRASIGPAGP